MNRDELAANGALKTAFDTAIDYISRLDKASVSAELDLKGLRTQLNKKLELQGLDAQVVINELIRDVQGGLHGNAGGRFYGWVIGSCLPSALAADWLTSAWDQNAGMYSVAPAAAVAEEVAGAWLKRIFGLPDDASFAFVTGCQMAHTTALAAARHHVLERMGWDAEAKGLFGAPPIRFLCSDQKHGSVVRAARFLGIGDAHIVDLKTNLAGRIELDALRQALAAYHDAPMIVLLQAGDINTGAFDDFETLIPLAHEAGAWVHVDGAFGMFATASPALRHLTNGYGKADSWATDGHKWLNVPYDCGYAFTAHPASHRAAMTLHASYLSHATEARDQIDWNPEFSRRARAFPTYAAIRELGTAGVADLVDRCCLHARNLVQGIGSLPGAEVVAEPIINQGLIRFRSPRPSGDSADDERTDEVIAAIRETGEAFFTGSTWRGKRVMRVSVCSWKTTELDVQRAIDATARVLTTNLKPTN